MKRQKYYLAAGALLCTSVVGALSPTLQTYATGEFEFNEEYEDWFDEGAQRCLVENYNINKPTGAEEASRFDNIIYDFYSSSESVISNNNIIECSSTTHPIENFSGIKYLEALDGIKISNSPNLKLGEDFIVWDLPLKELTLLGIDYTKSGYLDLSGDDNTIYKIYADDGLKIKTPGYTIKQDSGYSLDLTEFLYNPKPEDEWTFSFPSISGYPFEVEGYKLIFEDKVPETVTIKIRFPGSSDPEQFYTYNILTRGGTLTYNIYSDNYADLKENKYIKDNCEANDTGKYFTCTSDVYSGDSIDTDAFVKELGLTDYAVSKIETVKSTSATFTTNEDTVKKGTVGPDAEIELKLQLDTDASDGPAVPDTGIFTTSGTTIVATTAAATITLAGTAFYLSRHATKRQKSKVRFGKK